MRSLSPPVSLTTAAAASEWQRTASWQSYRQTDTGITHSQYHHSFRMNYWSRWIRSRTLGHWLQKTVFRTRLNRGQAIGASLQKIWKSHRIPISTKIWSASVACSNVRLWKLDTQKEWRNTSWRLWDERIEIDSAGFMDSKENKWVGS